MQLAVNDRAAAEETFGTLFGAERARLDESAHLNASRTVLSIGESELELCEARGPGIVRDFVDRWGEGLLCAGYASAQHRCARRTSRRNRRAVRTGGRTALPARHHHRRVSDGDLAALEARPRVGPVSFFYEATNTLDSNWQDRRRSLHAPVPARRVEVLADLEQTVWLRRDADPRSIRRRGSIASNCRRPSPTGRARCAASSRSAAAIRSICATWKPTITTACKSRLLDGGATLIRAWRVDRVRA